MIQTRKGRVILTAMKLLNNPGRHSVLTYVTDDNGNLSDLAHRHVPVELPAEKLMEAQQRGYFAYRFTFELEGGKRSMRIGVDDVLAHTTSAIVADLNL
jgi:hypothetical protein